MNRPTAPVTGRPSRRRALALALAAPLLATACSSGGGPHPAAAPTAGATASPTASAAPYDATALRTPSGRFLGVASEGGPEDLGPVTAFAAKTGRPADVREYYQVWGDDFDPAGNAALWRNGQLPLLTWAPVQTGLASIASGSEDAYLTRFADQVRSYQGPLVIDFAPEMNADWNAWGPAHAKPADYVAAWKRVHDAFRDRAVTNVVWLWSPHVTDSAAKAPLKPYFPGEEYVDWVGLVGYYGPQEGSDFTTLFNPTVKSLRALTGKPLVIAETGVAEGPRKPGQVADLFAGAARTEGLVGLVWFDLQKTWPGSTVPTDWRVDSSAAAADAVAKAAAGKGFGHPFTG
ncbi:glycoside hydrolase family 26 protein [Kitasatospora camelliae]|uniref:Glycosyl hydrolase n=1 Tax=Kitasatospora camelliae TaxID=3156397 RepID=A0AAU8K146_9ACTN